MFIIPSVTLARHLDDADPAQYPAILANVGALVMLSPVGILKQLHKDGETETAARVAADLAMAWKKQLASDLIALEKAGSAHYAQWTLASPIPSWIEGGGFEADLWMIENAPALVADVTETLAAIIEKGE